MKHLLLTLLLLAGLAVTLKAQETLKMIDGTKMVVKVLDIRDNEVVYMEMSDPLYIEYKMPRNRVISIAYDNGKEVNLRDDKDNVLVLTKKSAVLAPDSLKEHILLKNGQIVEGRIVTIGPKQVTYRKFGSTKNPRYNIDRTEISKVVFADGKSRDLETEEGLAARVSNRVLFRLDDPTSPDQFLMLNFPKKATKSIGLLYDPDEVLNLRRWSNLEEAKNDRYEVRYLDLSNKNLTKLPDEVKTFKRLVALDLSSNPISEFPQEALGLPNLQYLFIDSCQLKELKPIWEAGKKSNLIFISARGNQIEELSPDITELQSLYCLRLGGNKIAKIRNKGFSNAANSSLSILELAHNQLSFIPYALSAYPNLTYLNLRYNAITEVSDKVTGFSRLVVFDAQGNPITKAGPAFCNIGGLERVYLNNTRLPALPEGIQGWKGVKALYLPGTLAALPGWTYERNGLREFAVKGKAPGGKTMTIPAAMPNQWDSLRLADLSGLDNSENLAYFLRIRYPNLLVRYFDTELNAQMESMPLKPNENTALTTISSSSSTLSEQMLKETSDFFLKRGDQGMAVLSLKKGYTLEPAQAMGCQLALADLYANPAMQTILPQAQQLRDYISMEDYTTFFKHQKAFESYNQVCLAQPQGEAMLRARNKACHEASSILKKTAAGLLSLTKTRITEQEDLKREAALLEGRATDLQAKATQ